MREFFKGWRRKAGVVTLVMACAACCLWAESFYREDEILFAIGETQHVITISSTYAFWGRIEDQDASQLLNERQSHPAGRLDGLVENKIKWGTTRWNSRSVFFASGTFVQFSVRIVFWIIPMSLIVWPPTLASAALLLWPQRKAKTTSPPQS